MINHHHRRRRFVHLSAANCVIFVEPLPPFSEVNRLLAIHFSVGKVPASRTTTICISSGTMSLYSQNQFYPQPYPAPGYPQPPAHSAYHYQQPVAPAPVYLPDPVTFRRDYSTRLAELTVNSRPIIQNLSMLAQEMSRYAEIVAQCLEAHIRRVSHLSVRTSPGNAPRIMSSAPCYIS